VNVGAGDGAASLRDYLRIARRRKWVILLAAVLVPAAAVVFSERQERLYEASASVLLSNQNLATSLAGGTATPGQSLSNDPQRITQTQAELARTPVVALQTLRALKLTKRTPAEFLKRSSVSTNQNSDILIFNVTDHVPGLAARLANEYARQYTIYRSRLDTNALVLALRDVRGRISALQTQGQAGSALYANLVEKEQELSTFQALETSNATVVRRASGASLTQPRTLRNGALGLGLGVLLGLALAFLWETLDTRVRSADAISDALGLPLLGRLPAPPRDLRRSNNLVMVEEPTSPDAEPFRVLLTNLELVSLEPSPRTIMITSARESEGKSTTAANLAVTIARSGKRVALVDLDLRRPFIHEFFHIPPEPGVTTMAVGRATLDDALVPIPLGDRPEALSDGHPAREGSLHLLCSGTSPPNPGEFIRSPGVARLLSHLSESFDTVIVDSAPLLGVGDALVLIPRVDALIIVARLKVLRAPMLEELKRILETSLAQKLGFVLTDAQHEESYAGGHGYGYGYGARRQRAYHRAPERPLDEVST
jgi:succinoglycan biosynthesis transport protein ExoP